MGSGLRVPRVRSKPEGQWKGRPRLGALDILPSLLDGEPWLELPRHGLHPYDDVAETGGVAIPYTADDHVPGSVAGAPPRRHSPGTR
jgi:hypothetical protein